MNNTRDGISRFQPYANMHRIVVIGRDTCNGSCETNSGCDCTATTGYGSAYGGLQHIKPPTVTPCSTLARWLMNIKAWL